MKKSGKLNRNVVEFGQSLAYTKQFNNDYPISTKNKKVMISELRDFTKYLTQNYRESAYLIQEFIDAHQVNEEKEEALFHHLFWWRMLYESNQDDRFSHVENYIACNRVKLNKKPLIISWLKEWEKAIPTFYYVEYIYHEQVIVVVDIYTKETLDVIVYDPTATPAKKGEIVMGTLLPIGNRLYFPILDFYHFDLEASKDIAIYLTYYHEKHAQNPSDYEAFIRVLSKVLQVEELVTSGEMDD